MASYDALRYASIGQYVPGRTLVHRLDPRAKVLLFALLVGAVAAATSYAANLILLLLVASIGILADVSPAQVWRMIRPVLPIIILFALLQLFLYQPREQSYRVLFSWQGVRITDINLRLVIISLLRLVDLLILVSVLTRTTTISALIFALLRLAAPLAKLGLPAESLAMIGAIALRFVPILGEQMESIMMAQAARGLPIESAGRWRIGRNARRVALMIIPLFVDAYRRSEEMALAMRARCYHTGGRRTHLNRYHWQRCDTISLIGVVFFVLVAFVFGS